MVVPADNSVVVDNSVALGDLMVYVGDLEVVVVKDVYGLNQLLVVAW